jgi:hypothetical protein
MTHFSNAAFITDAKSVMVQAPELAPNILLLIDAKGRRARCAKDVLASFLTVQCH